MASQVTAREAGRHLVYRARWGTIGMEWAVCGDATDHRDVKCRSAPPTARVWDKWRVWEEVNWKRLTPMVVPLEAWKLEARVAAAKAEKYASMWRNRWRYQRWQVLTLAAWKKCWEQSKRIAPKTDTTEATAAATVTTRGAKRRARREETPGRVLGAEGGTGRAAR